MDFSQLIITRRSIRKFTQETISDDDIKKLKVAALCAPTSKNCKSWQYAFVTNKDKIKALAAAKEAGSEFLSEAPLAIVVMADTTKTDVWVEDCSIAATFIQLQAQDLGLGSCWAQMRLRKDASGNMASYNIKNLLNLPADFDVLCVIGIGHPDQQRRPYEEEKLPWDNIRDIK